MCLAAKVYLNRIEGLPRVGVGWAAPSRPDRRPLYLRARGPGPSVRPGPGPRTGRRDITGTFGDEGARGRARGPRAGGGGPPRRAHGRAAPAPRRGPARPARVRVPAGGGARSRNPAAAAGDDGAGAIPGGSGNPAGF